MNARNRRKLERLALKVGDVASQVRRIWRDDLDQPGGSQDPDIAERLQSVAIDLDNAYGDLYEVLNEH